MLQQSTHAFLNPFLPLWNILYMTGTKNSVSSVEYNMPPMTVMATGLSIDAPALVSRAENSKPIMVVRDVMIIGLILILAAVISASCTESASSSLN